VSVEQITSTVGRQSARSLLNRAPASTETNAKTPARRIVRTDGARWRIWRRGEHTLTGLAKERADPAMEAMARGGGGHEERESDRGVGWGGKGRWVGWSLRSDLPTFMRGAVMAHREYRRRGPRGPACLPATAGPTLQLLGGVLFFLCKLLG
jgi:hypothetical protein